MRIAVIVAALVSGFIGGAKAPPLPTADDVAVAVGHDGRQEATGGARVAVLAELFTSEGCSSCPPADDLLRRLIEEQPIKGVEIIALSEHVDYWDRLGWKDPFSAAQFTERQNSYSRVFGSDRIYTPQLVIDGRFEAVGSDWPEVRRALTQAAKTPHAAVAASATRASSDESASVHVLVRDLPNTKSSASVLVAVVEDDLVTEVARGENARKRLRHSAVVRSLEKIGTLDKGVASGEFNARVHLKGEWRAICGYLRPSAAICG